MPLQDFHPAVAGWFRSAFAAPTPAQTQAWPAIRSGRHALIAAPTGSGKTFAAFLAALDELVRRGVAGDLRDETYLVYVSPLKALSNDIRINLEAPLAGIRAELARLGLPDVEIRSIVRTGDTPQAERARAAKRPPHIVVTTPESLYLLLGSESGRAMLATTESVVVDEIHALLPSKRGSHLALSLERLEALCGRRLARIGLSATQKPIDEVARFLAGCDDTGKARTDQLTVVDVGYSRRRDLAIETPAAPLEAVLSTDQWQQIHARLAELALGHRTTLVFVNTRRMVERIARHLSERLGTDQVAAHHGSLAKEHRLAAERRLKAGELRVLVATASLELGIDIGDVELVCQIGSPRSIAAFLQRVGRSGHAVGGLPKGRLFPQSRDDLVECVALLDSVRRGELDRIEAFRNPLDVLAQQIAAEVAAADWDERALLALVRRAYPFATLSDAQFKDTLATLVQGYRTRGGTRSAMLHRDAVHGVLHGRRGTRITALTSGGTIPDMADYEVVLEPAAQTIGSVNEDFAVESLVGDVFQLGNASYQILRVERGKVRVQDAHGAPPSIPFWLGEAPGRSDELSQSVSRLRAELGARLDAGRDAADAWLDHELALAPEVARQLADYLANAKAALGALPTLDTLVLERFFDESGGSQLVIHSAFGSRVNRAFGLALRKRFCRKFNFELQAAATEDAIVLSLSQSHSFPLEEVARYLHSNTVADVLTQAVLDAPMFGVRWRWNATTALALPRFQGGKRVAPQIQRMRSEDLLASVFPDQVACAENLTGEREIPDHPLVAQTLHDCLHDAMDLDGLVELLKRMESGAVRVVARDLAEPSPLAAEVLSARPYSFLDDAPLEERRTQAVQSRRWQDPEQADDLGKLDADAIAAVRAEAWPEPRDIEEMHQALLDTGFLTQGEVDANPAWASLLEPLRERSRATLASLSGGLARLWIAAERVPEFRALDPALALAPELSVPEELAAKSWGSDEALVELARARLAALGPVRAADVARTLAVPEATLERALFALEQEGYVMRGRFTPDADSMEWCERHLLARIHRYTVRRLRAEIEPVSPRDFMRFLLDWQRVAPGTQGSGPDALAAVLAQLEGFQAPVAAWESRILPTRIADYEISWLDELCRAGRLVWMRVPPRASGTAGERSAGPIRSTPIVMLKRTELGHWMGLTARQSEQGPTLSSRAQATADFLAQHGASFYDELSAGTGLLRAELENALGELVAAGKVNADSFAGLRALLVPSEKRPARQLRHGRRRALMGVEDAGRWALIRKSALTSTPEAVEYVARCLLRRWGVVCWRLLEREADWLPPWRDLQRVFQRLEARGEIRGGRFIEGLSGQQFAQVDAVAALRKVRQRPDDGTDIVVSGADPLNLVGSILAGSRVPALTTSRILFRDGAPIATLVAGEVNALIGLDPADSWRVRSALLGRRSRADAPVTS